MEQFYYFSSTELSKETINSRYRDTLAKEAMFSVEKGAVVLLSNVLPQSRGNPTRIDSPLAAQVDKDGRAINEVLVVDIDTLGNKIKLRIKLTILYVKLILTSCQVALLLSSKLSSFCVIQRSSTLALVFIGSTGGPRCSSLRDLTNAFASGFCSPRLAAAVRGASRASTTRVYFILLDSSQVCV